MNGQTATQKSPKTQYQKAEAVKTARKSTGKRQGKATREASQANKGIAVGFARKIADEFVLKLKNDREYRLLAEKCPSLSRYIDNNWLTTLFIRVAAEVADEHPDLLQELLDEHAAKAQAKTERKLEKTALELKELKREFRSVKRKMAREIKKAEADLKKEKDRNADLLAQLESKNGKIKELEEELLMLKARLQIDHTNSGIPKSMSLFGDERREADGDGKEASTQSGKGAKGSPEKKKAKGAKEEESEEERKPVPNTREKTNNRPGGQKGRKGKTLTIDFIESLRKAGVKVETIDIGEVDGERCVKGYVLDLEIVPVIKEIRVPKGQPLPKELWGGPIYGPVVRKLCVLLSTEGLMGFDRLAGVINQLSGNRFDISEGSVFNYCEEFYQAARPHAEKIRECLAGATHLATDATMFWVDKKRRYIRNHSTREMVWYYPVMSKKTEDIIGNPLLDKYRGCLLHDHETALYSLNCEHAECNIHLIRRLLKLDLYVDHTWTKLMRDLFRKYDHKRNLLLKKGEKRFERETTEAFEEEFGRIIRLARSENETETVKKAKKKEASLINDLVKYRKEHTRFLYDFSVDFTDNISERDLRIAVRKRKMIGCFRNFHGLEMYCGFITIVETAKKQGIPVLSAIDQILCQANPFWELFK